MPWRKHNKLTLSDVAGIIAAALAVASCVFIFQYTIILRLSEIRPVPWFLTEGEVDVLVDPSTWWTNLKKVQPGTNNRDYLSSLIVPQSYVRILLCVHHLVCKGHFWLYTFKCSPLLYSQLRLDAGVILTILSHRTFPGCTFHRLYTIASTHISM